MKVSVIIPTFNEQKSIIDCLVSLQGQSLKDFEIIVVDDGSTDKTVEKIESWRSNSLVPLKLLHQAHQGPGLARNKGAKEAVGEILVFVDADMTFDEHFLEKLIKPIAKDNKIGTFSKEERVLNQNNLWGKAWNLNKNLPIDRMHPLDYPDHQPVFRAIKKSAFIQSGGFRPIGYIDDYTISQSLGEEAVVAPGAIFYHRNPENLAEIWQQARWVGKSEYKNRKIKNEFLMKLIVMIRYSLPFSLIGGTIKAVSFNLPFFILFKIIYDLAIEISVIESFFTKKLYK